MVSDGEKEIGYSPIASQAQPAGRKGADEGRGDFCNFEAMPSAALVEDPCHGENTDEDGRRGEEAKRNSTSVTCEECGEREARYRCPGCGLRSCGLHCVKSHKERTQCLGKRKRTSFVPLGAYDDNVLMSDYNLLEEILRQADSAQRARAPLNRGKAQLPRACKHLQTQARNRSTTLVFLSQGMSKREANTSCYERKTKRIFWRVEWSFEGTEVRLTDPKVDENLSLESILSKLMTGEGVDVKTKHKLRTFCRKPVEELKLLLCKEGCAVPGKSFYDLNSKSSFRDQLANKFLIEHPVIHVVLLEDAANYTIAAEEKPTLKGKDEQQAARLITPTLDEPEGVPFKEEEIEEGEFFPC